MIINILRQYITIKLPENLETHVFHSIDTHSYLAFSKDIWMASLLSSVKNK
jgi:hypothetical protein